MAATQRGAADRLIFTLRLDNFKGVYTHGVRAKMDNVLSYVNAGE
jgi:hypothetical protein